MRPAFAVLGLALLCTDPAFAQAGGPLPPIVSLALSPRSLRLGLDAERRLTAMAQDSAKRNVSLGGRKVALPTVSPIVGARAPSAWATRAPRPA